MKKLIKGLLAVAVMVVGAGCAAQEVGSGESYAVGEASSPLVACPLSANTAGSCSSALPVTDPLSLGAVTLTWEQSVDLDRAGGYARGEETVTARDAAGGIVAQLYRSFTLPDDGEVYVSANGASGDVLWDSSGAILRDTVTGHPGLEAANLWLSDAPPKPSEFKENCNWSGDNCLCQCEASWPWDHAICASAKLVAYAQGECALTGWWYCQSEGGGAKCGNKP